MRARTFMQVSIGILALALAYHFGASSAGAQGAGYPIVAMVINPGGAPHTGGALVAANGDVYTTDNWATWYLTGNAFTGPPTPVQSTSFGALKARYR